MNTFLNHLGKDWLFCDGGMGTILQEKGLRGGELPETWNLTRPQDILDLHCAYLNAGCHIFNTNTFGANALKYPDNLTEIVQQAVFLAKEARTRTHREDAYIALDIGPTGKLLEPLGDLPFEKAVSLFGEVIRIGAAAGADLVLIETMSDGYEAKAAVLAAKENCSLPVLITTIFDAKGKLLTGGTVDSTVAMLEGLHVDALGVNCGLGPVEMLPIIKRLVAISSVPVIVNPNAGLPHVKDNITYFDITPDDFATAMATIADLGVHVIGGCCGTTPLHIEKMIARCKDKPFHPVTLKHRSVVSSFSKAVVIGERPLLIGERINPTGKKVFKEALRNHDLEYILSEGLKQENAGADILDVNVGLPDIDEAAMMADVVTELQSVTDLPLQIDTSDIAALERGMRLYNGKPMVNSVNGKAENIAAVFPLLRKYGGVLVGLCLDEDGIPPTADGRIAVARKIYAAADFYGVPREDIILDGLAMTVSSDSHSALVTLETIRRIRDELHGHSVLGVSNISFGLPARPVITSYFLSMAMLNGLSCAIINPQSEPIMAAYHSYLALTDQDPQCMGYVNAFAKTALSQNTTADPADSVSLGDAILHGMKGKAASAMKQGISEGNDPLDLIRTHLIPALDRVGRGFEDGSVFLPQLLMSAEAAKAAFDVVKESMRGKPQKIKGTVLLATVRGDIHDIGKNIVKVMLENYGYTVLDLGKDVAPETILNAAKEHAILLVGLSALMTTTVGAMEETITLLHREKPDTRIIVGGAVLTQDYADQIGADAYAKDAMATVRYADSLFL